MNELLPYEEKLEQQLNDLVLPDENMAWEDMKRRLKEEDDDKIIFWWRRGCMLWGLLLLALLGAGWWLLQRSDWFHKKKDAVEITITEKNDSDRLKVKKNDSVDLKSNDVAEQTDKNEITTNEKLNTDSLKTLDEISVKRVNSSDSSNEIKSKIDKTDNKSSIGSPIAIDDTKSVKTKKPAQPTREKAELIRENKNNRPQETTNKEPADDKTELKNPDIKPRQDSIVDLSTANPNKDSSKIVLPIAVGKTDSLKKDEKRKDTATVKKTITKPEEPMDKSISFSAGLGLHQQLPIAGQKLTPYNSLGRKGNLGDYIPSVYFRVNKKDKWFIQSEFRYGAPQYTKEFLYQQKSVPDTGSNPRYTTISSSKLKKTFYHQLPISFNYFILPNWSVGTGIQWNKFNSAVSEKEVFKKNNFTQIDSLVSKIVQNDKKDTASVFEKNYFLAVFETQYKWKKFSVGAKYTFGLQPYIKFTLPGGSPQQEKSTSIQIFVRYQLFQSKEK